MKASFALGLWLCLVPLLRAQPPATYALAQDWLLDPAPFAAKVERTTDRVVLTNGLVWREFVVGKGVACVSLRDLTADRELLRGPKEEAHLRIDGVDYRIGGLMGQTNTAYLTKEVLAAMTPEPGALVLTAIREGVPLERHPWKRVRHTAPDATWPPKGVSVEFEFAFPKDAPLHGLGVTVHYELYDGVPSLSKWVTIVNQTDRTHTLEAFTAETLALIPHEDPVETREGATIAPPSCLHVETDQAFGGFTHKNSSLSTVHWSKDEAFATQVNWARTNPCLLEVKPRRGPDQTLAPGATFETFRVFEMVYDSTDRERRGLALRKHYRTIAPWVTENPLILHVVSTDETVVHRAIDQAAECGFEMVSLSFGSGLNMEDITDQNLAKFRGLVDYAKERGIHLGGYSLLSSRRIGNGMDVVSPPGEQPTHGSCPALASPFGQEYFKKLRRFFNETGFLQFTHDGSYPGDFDVTARPPIQKGLNDSQWVQWNIIADFYRELRAKGVYLRIPDYYYLVGGNECGMGYREVNWSLPRIEQQIHTRMNIFDGTWEKTPSMGWMFVPLTQYHGGGAAATIEPLSENLPHYEMMLASNLLLGVQAVYRGHRLYDTEATKAMVCRMVALYKRHRDILESDLLHLRRPDGRDLDAMLHVNPKLRTKALLAAFNPLNQEVTRELLVPLYYAGLSNEATYNERDTPQQPLKLDRYHRARIQLTLPPRGYTWLTFQ